MVDDSDLPGARLSMGFPGMVMMHFQRCKYKPSFFGEAELVLMVILNLKRNVQVTRG
jgi:hypothetical protein